MPTNLPLLPARTRGVVALCGVLALVVLCYVGFVRTNARNAAPDRGTARAQGIYIENTAYYDVEAHFATTSPLAVTAGDHADAAAMAHMQTFVFNAVDSFLAAAAPTTDDTKARPSPENPTDTSSLAIDYVTASSPNTLSFVFHINESLRGAAHGVSSSKTFTFDKRTGSLLTLADLFKPNSKYLQTLSNISRAQLPVAIEKKTGAPWAVSTDLQTINEGTTPDAKNFRSFYLEKSDLVLIFDPYDVAAYVAGPQTLRIAASDLQSILNSQYP